MAAQLGWRSAQPIEPASSPEIVFWSYLSLAQEEKNSGMVIALRYDVDGMENSRK
jgi:hypothetical protein